MSLNEIEEDIDMGMVGSLKPTKDDVVAELLIQQLGGSPRFVRERRQTVRRLVSESYFPPRITKEIVEGKWKHVAASPRVRVRPHGDRSPRWIPLVFQPRQQAQQSESALEEAEAPASDRVT